MQTFTGEFVVVEKGQKYDLSNGYVLVPNFVNSQLNFWPQNVRDCKEHFKL